MAKPNPSAATDKTYKLTRDAAPLSYMLPVRNSRRFPLLWYDEKNNVNRALRYAVNQKSPFEDEQDGNAIIEPVIFEDGLLFVPRTSPALQEFLFYHPMNGTIFVEVNQAQDAEKELQMMNEEIDAVSEARKLNLDQLETVARVLFGKDVSNISTPELRRDVIIFAKKNPKLFMNSLSNPELEMQSKVQSFFDKKLIQIRGNGKEVWFNTPTNKKKMLGVPFGDDPKVMALSYLQSDEGLDYLKMLENCLSSAD